MRNRFTKIAAIVSLAGLLQLGGCSWDSFIKNVWRGFGYSIGGLPAGFVTDAITGVIGGIGDIFGGNNNNNNNAGG